MQDQPRPTSWYLDPIVARQKKQAHLDLIRRWTRGLDVRTYLKTDLFEEANGEDQLLFDLMPPSCRAIGMDLSVPTAAAASRRSPNSSVSFLSCDVRLPAIRPGSLDLIISTSTLDHLRSSSEFRESLVALAGLLREGGLLIITVDNLHNPLYRPLRWASRRGWLPFELGYTPSMRDLRKVLSQTGFEVAGDGWLLHNPRAISTLLWMFMRKLFKDKADTPIALMLEFLDRLGDLPTRRWTACFAAACARRCN